MLTRLVCFAAESVWRIAMGGQSAQESQANLSM